jgi:hypothetical protein
MTSCPKDGLQVKPVFDVGSEQPSSSSNGPSPAVKQRITGKMRARIDIDDEIEEANKISDMLRKVSKRAKTMQRSSKKAKRRLVVKASKLRAEDLERIAVLKRCGLFVSDETTVQEAKGSEVCVAELPAKISKGKVQRRLADIIEQTDGSAGLLNFMQTRHKAKAGAPDCGSPIAGSVLHVAVPIPTGVPLGNHNHNQSSKSLEVVDEAAVEEELLAISNDFE